jgi:hypothetical protein
MTARPRLDLFLVRGEDDHFEIQVQMLALAGVVRREGVAIDQELYPSLPFFDGGYSRVKNDLNRKTLCF